MSQKNSIKSNFIFNAIYQLTNILVPLVTLPYLSRVLHAEGLGEYSFAYSVAYYFYLFIRLGLHNYGNRTIAYVKDDSFELSKIFSEIYAFQFFMGIAMTVIYLGYSVFVAPRKELAIIFSLYVISGGIDITWALYGLEEFKVTSVRDALTKLLTALAIFAFVKENDDVWKYALIYSLGFLIDQIIVIPIILKRIRIIIPDILGVIAHIKPNLILFLPTVAVSIYKTMDKIMLGTMATEEELGYYHSCENVVYVPLALITALGTVMLPRMSNMISNKADKGKLDVVFEKSVSFAMFVSSSVCMGIMTVAKEFVPVFYGIGFDKCIYIFYIILPSCIFLAFANVIRTQFILPRKRDALFVVSLFSGAGVNLLLNALLIPHYAAIGASIGTLAAEIVVCIIQAAYVYKEANIGKNVVNSIPFLLAGILMFAIFFNYKPVIENAIMALIVKIVICGTFYMLLLGGMLGIKRLLKFNSIL
nr:flippase [uncultured Butyrivibrio sp.]